MAWGGGAPGRVATSTPQREPAVCYSGRRIVTEGPDTCRRCSATISKRASSSFWPGSSWGIHPKLRVSPRSVPSAALHHRPRPSPPGAIHAHVGDGRSYLDLPSSAQLWARYRPEAGRGSVLGSASSSAVCCSSSTVVSRTDARRQIDEGAEGTARRQCPRSPLDRKPRAEDQPGNFPTLFSSASHWQRDCTRNA